MNATHGPRDVHELITVLPDVPVLRDRCRALAALDAVMGRRGGSYFDYDPAWGPGVEAALMTNGAGDEYTILFTPDGVFGRGFDHESWMSPYTNDDMALWPGLVDTLPEVFRPLLAEAGLLRRRGADGHRGVLAGELRHRMAGRAGGDPRRRRRRHGLPLPGPGGRRPRRRTRTSPRATTSATSTSKRSATCSPCAPSRRRWSRP